MTLEEGLVTHLKADAGVSAITTIVEMDLGRTAADSRQGATPTQIIYTLVNRLPDDSVDDESEKWREADFSFLCVSESPATAIALGDAAEDALYERRGTYGTVTVNSVEHLGISSATSFEVGLYARELRLKFRYRR